MASRASPPLYMKLGFIQSTSSDSESSGGEDFRVGPNGRRIATFPRFWVPPSVTETAGEVRATLEPIHAMPAAAERRRTLHEMMELNARQRVGGERLSQQRARLKKFRNKTRKTETISLSHYRKNRQHANKSALDPSCGSASCPPGIGSPAPSPIPACSGDYVERIRKAAAANALPVSLPPLPLKESKERMRQLATWDVPVPDLSLAQQMKKPPPVTPPPQVTSHRSGSTASPVTPSLRRKTVSLPPLQSVRKSLSAALQKPS